MQQLLASKEALVSQGARQALAAATVAASAELAAMRSTLQVLSSHLDALQAQPAAPASKGASHMLDSLQRICFSSSCAMISHAASLGTEKEQKVNRCDDNFCQQNIKHSIVCINIYGLYMLHS